MTTKTSFDWNAPIPTDKPRTATGEQVRYAREALEEEK